MGGDGLEIRLLGTIDACRNGEAVALPGRRVRALLSMLAVSAGRSVSVDSLARGVWDDEPPERVRGSLQTYVGRLRALIGTDRVATTATGYRLDVPREAVDLLAYSDAIDTAASRPPESERAGLASVLRLWDCDPFDDAPSDWIARHERPQWVERRLQAFERWVDLSFGAGEHAGCLIQLNHQIERHPLRETLWTRLLTGLDHAGRTAEALERYEEVRKRLADELGVDPSPELRAVYARLLERSDEPPIPSSPPPPVPQQLPIRVAGFVGRDAELARLDEILPATATVNEPWVVALHGPAGSGKTTLAVHWAHRVKDRFADGQLFVNLRGYGPGEPMSTAHALGQLLRGVGVEGSRVPDETDDRAAMLRAELAGRRMLMVLDNARDTEQVRPLLPGADGLVIVTSRRQLRGLARSEGARRVEVQELSRQQAVSMLATRIGTATDRPELEELAELCGRLPVALAVAAERAGRDDGRSLVSVNATLRESRGRLEALSSWDHSPVASVRAVLEWSYASLDEDVARMFRLLGAYEGHVLTVGAASALAGLPRPDAAGLLDRLANDHLVREIGTDLYEAHDLVRDFSTDLFGALEPEEHCRAARRRLRSWFLHSASNACAVWSPPATKIVLPEVEPRVVPASFDDTAEAFAWFDIHASGLRRTVIESAQEGDPVGHLLAPMLLPYLKANGIVTRDGLDLFRLAEDSARRLGDLSGQALCANCVARCEYESGDAVSALATITRARDLYVAAGDDAGQLVAQANIALALFRMGRVDEAADAYEKAITDARRLDNRAELGSSLFNASHFYLEVGRVDDAVRAGEEAVAVLRVAGDENLLAFAVENLGDLLVAQGRAEEAVATLHEAADSYRRAYLRTDLAEVLHTLGRQYLDLGAAADARACWLEAQQVLADLGLDATREVSRTELAGLLDDLARDESA